MAATLAELIDAVADQIADVISDVTDVTVHVESGLFRSAEMPAINVYPSSPGSLPQELAAFGDLHGGWPMNIRVAVSPADQSAGEALLWGFMDDGDDPLSIIAALNYDRTLGGLADTLMWGDWAGYQDFSPPDTSGTFVGSTLPIIVAKAPS